jgi:3-dehydroquinate dehydratase II
MKILVISGPNLNMLGKRDPNIYGNLSLEVIKSKLCAIAQKCDCSLVFFRSNHEGEIIDFLQKSSSRKSDGILINPGALTHYGYSLRDALVDTDLPVVEVHLSDISKRENFRKIDVLTGVTVTRFMGEKEKSYLKGLKFLIKKVKENNHE